MTQPLSASPSHAPASRLRAAARVLFGPAAPAARPISAADRCDMFTVEEYFPEPDQLRYLVKRDGLLLFGLWPEELAELKAALQSLPPADSSAAPDTASADSQAHPDH